MNSFRHIVPSLVVLLAISGLIGCTNKKTAEYQAESARLNQLTEESKAKLNAFRIGGQPGLIKISVVKSENSKEALSKIKIKSEAGAGFDGVVPDVNIDKVQLLELSEQSFAKVNDWNDLANNKIIVNVGCDDELVKKYNFADSVVIDQSELSMNLELSKLGVYDITTHTVLLCHSEILQGHDLIIRAKKIILNGFEYKTPDAPIKMITIGLRFETETLELLGRSELISVRSPELYPTQYAPGIGITTKIITGDGSLSIKAIGASATQSSTQN